MSIYKIDAHPTTFGWEAEITWTPAGEPPRDEHDSGPLSLQGPEIWRPTHRWAIHAALRNAMRHSWRVDA